MAIALSKLICSVLVSTGLALSLIAAPAQAAKKDKNPDDTTPTSSTIACDINHVSLGGIFATSCEGPFSGNDTGSGDLVGQLDAGLFDIGPGATWSLFGKSDDGSGKVNAGNGSTGEWNLNKELLNGVQTFVISLKASTSYSAYLFEDFDFSKEGALLGLYDTIGVAQNGQGKAKGLSHASIFLSNQRKTPRFSRAKVPESESIIGLGLVTGAMFMKRRRKSNPEV